MIYFDGSHNSDAFRDGETFTDNTGVWHEWDAYGRRRYWQIRIDNDTPCDCYSGVKDDCHNGSPSKGIICTAWPLHPDHVSCFDNCSFKFVKMNEWEMDESSRLTKEDHTDEKRKANSDRL
jgi:hypothetical protein